MISGLIKISSRRKLENAILFLLLLFIFKLTFTINSSVVISLTGYIISLLSVYFSIQYFESRILSTKTSPLVVVKYMLLCGVTTFIIFFTLYLSVETPVFFNSLINSIISNLLIIFLIVSLSYILAGFKHLIQIRVKKTPLRFFNVMLFFFIAAGVFEILTSVSKEYDFLLTTSLIMSYIFLGYNSIKVAWIALLTKKEKLVLLFISVMTFILFVVNYINYLLSDKFVNIITIYIPGLQIFAALIILLGVIYSIVIFFTTLFHLPTAEVFDRKTKELDSLIDLNNLLTRVFDVKELAETITETTIKVCNADAAWLFETGKGQNDLLSLKKIGYGEADKISEFVFSDLNKSGKLPAFIEKKLPAYLIEENFSSYTNCSVAPLKIKDEIKGFLFAAKKDNIRFDDDEQKTMVTYADYAALTLENARLIKESLEKERMERELDVARELQHKIIPSILPEKNNLKISALFIPAFEVGGDYYDFFELPDDRLAFVIADVSGKGISAAFVMSEIKGIFASLSGIIQNPKNLLSEANRILKKSLDKKSFVTAIYGIFDLGKGELQFSRCGHPPLFLVRDNQIFKYKPSGIGLGFDINFSFDSVIQEEKIILKDNDIIITFTDGITESKNNLYEDFGEINLEKVILENYKLDVDILAEKIMSAVSCYSIEQPQHDDITLVIFKWKNNNIGEIND